MENDELLHKWVNGDLTAEELESFKQRPEYEALRELYRETDTWLTPSFEEEKILSTILKTPKEAIQKESSQPKEARRIFLSNWIKYGVAASLLFAAAWFFLRPTTSIAELKTANAETKDATLPDGSSFVMNAGSKIIYDESNWSKNRTLNLEGEAFFTVKKGSTFKVITPNGGVQVLGTEFNVRSRNKALEVICKSGKVAVLSTQGERLKELFPRDAVRVERENIVGEWKMPADESGWHLGVFKFKNVPLKEVLAELERQFDVQFEVGNIDTSERLSSNFQNKDLNLALDTSVKPLGISYKIEGKRIRLFKE